MPTESDQEPVGAGSDPDSGSAADAHQDQGAERRSSLRNAGYRCLLAVPFVLAVVIGGLKYVGWQQHERVAAAEEAARAATETATMMLSYKPDSVQNELDAAKDRMTDPFRDSYSELVDDVVAPAAIQKWITAQATVPSAAAVSATPTHAVVLLFVNQVVTVGNEPPTATASSVRATLDKTDGRWLISGFDPV